jgi:hypothetical protein
MKEIMISRNKVKTFLSEQLTQEVLQMDEKKIFSLVRYEGIGGFGKISDMDLFVHLVELVPEFKLLKLVNADDNHILVSLKEEYAETEEEILTDITRLLQLKLT